MQHAIGHLKLHRVDSLCSFCGKTLLSAAGLVSHIKRCHNDEIVEKISCQICNAEVETKHLLERHMLWYHPTEEKKFKCEKCEKSFYTEFTLKRHDQLVHDVKVKCRVEGCDKLFYDNIMMCSHYLKFHKEGKNVSSLNLNCHQMQLI